MALQISRVMTPIALLIRSLRGNSLVHRAIGTGYPRSFHLYDFLAVIDQCWERQDKPLSRSRTLTILVRSCAPVRRRVGSRSVT